MAEHKLFFEGAGADEVAEAWLRLVVKKALPLNLFDDDHFRRAVAATAMAGRKIVKGGTDTFLPPQADFDCRPHISRLAL